MHEVLKGTDSELGCLGLNPGPTSLLVAPPSEIHSVSSIPWFTSLRELLRTD